jgi:hypothetical protein
MPNKCAHRPASPACMFPWQVQDCSQYGEQEIGGARVQVYSCHWPPIWQLGNCPYGKYKESHMAGERQPASFPAYPTPRSRSSRSNVRIPLGLCPFGVLCSQLLPASQSALEVGVVWLCSVEAKEPDSFLVTFKSLIPIGLHPTLSPNK